MTTVGKATFKNLLTYAELMDGQAAGPFVGLHLRESNRVHLRRTAQHGFFETADAPPADDSSWVFASLSHLKECLSYLECETLELLRMANGGIRVSTHGAAFESELRVHTVSMANSGFKTHCPGPVLHTMDSTWLRGFKIKPFTLVAPPVLDGTRIVMATSSAVITWDTELNLQLPSSPRKTFLQALGDAGEGMFALTEGGFFTVTFDGAVFCIGGHGEPVQFPMPDITGALQMAEVSANRFCTALRNAASVSADGAPITITPKGGILTRNQFGQPVRFGLGDMPPFRPFDIYAITARTVVAALEQAKDDVVTLFRLPSSHEKVIFSRGNCKVSITGAPSAIG